MGPWFRAAVESLKVKVKYCGLLVWLVNSIELVIFSTTKNEPRREKTNILVSDLVRHKPDCTSTEDGQRLEISDLESKGIILSK